MALADHVPPKRKHQVRYYGAAHHKTRRQLGITPACKVPRVQRQGAPKSRWARLLYRVFGLEPLRCECGGNLRLLAVVVAQDGLDRIHRHLGPPPQAPIRAPPRDVPLPPGIDAGEPFDDNIDSPFVNDIPEFRHED